MVSSCRKKNPPKVVSVQTEQEILQQPNFIEHDGSMDDLLAKKCFCKTPKGVICSKIIEEFTVCMQLLDLLQTFWISHFIVVPVLEKNINNG